MFSSRLLTSWKQVLSIFTFMLFVWYTNSFEILNFNPTPPPFPTSYHYYNDNNIIIDLALCIYLLEENSDTTVQRYNKVSNCL